MTHIFVRKLTIIGSDNGQAPGQGQAVVRTNAGKVNSNLRNKLQWTLKRNSYILIQENAFEYVAWEMAAILSRLNMLRQGRWSYERGNLVHDDVMALELFPHCCPFHWSLAYLSGVPDLFDHNKIFSGGDLSHYQVPRCIRVLFSFLWFVFIHHNFQFYFESCTYCNILDIYLS